MRVTKLLMITSAYPYGHGESFVKAELDQISKYFDEIELVPSYYTDTVPRQVKQIVNLDYASTRWGFFRKFHMLSSFVMALWKYKWRDDAIRILRHDRIYENVKELARALYRARLFERFLEIQFVRNKKKFDLIYFYWMVPEIVGAIGFRQSANVDVKIVSRAHGGDLYEERRSGGYFGLMDGIVSGIDEIYCISDHGKSYLTDKYPAMAEKLFTARLGVGNPGYLNIQPADEQLSIVSCAFVVAGKRLHLIVEAIAYLLDRDPLLRIKWTHVGDGELYERLRDYVVERLKDRADVVFTGYLTQEQLMNLYRNEPFDVFANVSDCEGIPVSLMEASSAGIPMIATDVGGSSEIVGMMNGVLISADSDIEAIGSALIRFKDKEFANAYRKNAWSVWNARFNAEINYNNFGRELLRISKDRAR